MTIPTIELTLVSLVIPLLGKMPVFKRLLLHNFSQQPFVEQGQNFAKGLIDDQCMFWVFFRPNEAFLVDQYSFEFENFVKNR